MSEAGAAAHIGPDAAGAPSQCGQAVAASNTTPSLRPAAVDPAVLAADLSAAFEARDVPDFGGANPKLWMLAVAVLMEKNLLDAAAASVRWLKAAYPNVDYLETLTTVFDRLPSLREAGEQGDFVFRVEDEVQIVPSSESDIVLFCFCGLRNKLNLPVPVVHRWLAKLRINLVYLRDPRQRGHTKGILALADDFAGSIRELHRIADALAARRILCFGTSLGGYSALQFALALNARGAMAFSAPTNAIPAGIELPPWLMISVENLRPFYESAKNPPMTRLVHGELNEHDRRSAEHLADLPTVSLEAVPGTAAHGLAAPLIRLGRLEGLFGWLKAQGQ